jgi:DNA-directed RNA polymerase subunit RPC12/RpoP
MQHSYTEQLQQEIEHPNCAKCGAPMWLTRIEPYEPDHDQRTFECQACGKITTEMVKFR